MTAKRVAVIGAGINGLAVARQLMLDHPDFSVTVFEKEADVARHQTSHNSGVVHAGLYYEPGSLKARLCTRGVQMIRDYCAAHALPYEECGKLVIALKEDELPRLETIYHRSIANGVPGVRMIGAEEMREIEPNCIGTSALHSPKTAITSYEAVARKMASEICSWGGSLRLETEVGKILERRDGAYIQGHDGILDDAPYDHVIACSGLQSDRLARASGDADEPRIVPFFGLYYVIDPAYKNHVKGLIYPVPDPRFPFLGVHFTKRIDGEMTIGPNAFISLGRENYSGRRLDIGDVADFMSFLGFWKFAAGNTAATLRELKTVISRKSFVAEAARYVPSLSAVTAVPAIRGIRAQAMQKNGRLVDDFVIRKQRYVTHIRNAPSPGATSSMAIAEYIVREVVAWQDK